MSLRACPIQGRLIVQVLPGGRAGAGAHVPAPGHAVRNETLATGGEYELTVVNAHGHGPGSWGGVSAHMPGGNFKITVRMPAGLHRGAAAIRTSQPAEMRLHVQVR